MIGSKSAKRSFAKAFCLMAALLVSMQATPALALDAVPALPTEAGSPLLAFLAFYGLEPRPEDLKAAQEFERLPANVRGALTEILVAFMGVQAAANKAFLGVELVQEADRLAVQAAQGQLLDAFEGLIDVAVAEVDFPKQHSSEDDPEVNVTQELGQKLKIHPVPEVLIKYAFNTKIGFNSSQPRNATVEHEQEICMKFPFDYTVPELLNINLREVANDYVDDVSLSIDTCGNDVYLNNGGGTRLGTGQFCALTETRGAAALFDLGGNDQYGDPNNPRGCGVNGGGALGAGLLFDAAGNDGYFGGNNGVNGGALQDGIGLLIDLAGNDVYRGGRFGVNGAGVGIGAKGALIDLVGNDLYAGDANGVNGAGILGSGLLADLSGNDFYGAYRFGVNGEAINGFGLLWDRGGLDTYADQEPPFKSGAGTDRTLFPKGTLGAQLDDDDLG